MIRLLQLLLSAILIFIGILYFFDFMRVDVLYPSKDSRVIAFIENERKLVEVKKTKREIQKRAGQRSNKAAEADELRRQSNEQQRAIDRLEAENKELKWKGVVGLHTIVDKILGLILALVGLKTAQLALRVKEVELKDKEVSKKAGDGR